MPALRLSGRSSDLIENRMPNRLHKFVEIYAHGRRTGRVAYVFGGASLSAPIAGSEWAEDTRFNVLNELRAKPKLKPIFSP